jgi:sugar lactone lactonase YvrE
MAGAVILAVRADATISTIAGTGTGGFNGDGITATTAQLDSPSGVFVDAFGNVYIADRDNHRIRKISALTGLISTIAGTGTGGFNGDGVAATAARINSPFGVTTDSSGNVYIADTNNSRIRKVSAGTGLISTIAGTGVPGYNVDGIAATTAKLSFPYGVSVDSTGNVYIADTYNSRIRKVSAGTGLISTIAGTGTQGYNGDGIAATTANLNYPSGVTVDSSGNVYIADTNNSRIRKVSAGTGLISTIAGTGTARYNGDGINATTAQINYPEGIFADSYGNVYIADSNNRRIRKVSAVTGAISTIAGTGMFGYNDDGIAATTANLSVPYDVSVDLSGNLYISDDYDQRIRKVTREERLTASLVVSTNPTATGRWARMELTAVNSGDLADVGNVTPSIEVTSGGRLVSLENGPTPASPVTLSPGASQTFTWTYSVSGAGDIGFTGAVVGTGEYTGGTLSASATAVLETQWSPEVAWPGNLPSAGRIQVRNNVFRVSVPGEFAEIVINSGGKSGDVDLFLYSRAGVPLGRIGTGPVVLGAAGTGSAIFDGRFDWKTLSTGRYWIRATGAVDDQKPIFIINETR